MQGKRNLIKHVVPMGTIGLLMGLLLLSSCTGSDASNKPKAGDPRKKLPVPVTVSSSAKKTVPVQLQAIGNVQAYATVSVKAQINGELMTVHFREGQDIKKDDPLFTIDPAPFKARLKQAEANLAKNKAQLENARKQVKRYASVVKKGYVAEEEYDQVVANAAALEATIKADEAAVENVRLELNYCFIRSMINGVAGDIQVDEGNIIKANDNDKPLVIINQVSPVYVAFSVPERNLSEIKKYMASGNLKVTAIASGNEDSPALGDLTFLDNTVDVTTGMIQLKATFPNEDRSLWPGQFVRVILTLTEQPDAVVVPSQAVQTGQQGQYVFVVKQDLTVEYRPVVVDRSLNDETIIAQGIVPGETVVTDGQLKLTAGASVKVVEGDGKSKADDKKL